MNGNTGVGISSSLAGDPTILRDSIDIDLPFITSTSGIGWKETVFKLGGFTLEKNYFPFI